LTLSGTQVGSTCRPSGPPSLKVRVLDPLSEPDWNSWLARWEESTVFHTTNWADVLRETYGFKPVYFTLTEGSEPRACVPVMEVESWITGRRGISLPFTDTCEPLFTAAGDGAVLFNHLIRHGRERHWKFLEWRGGAEPLRGARPALAFYSHTLSLAPSVKTENPDSRAADGGEPLAGLTEIETRLFEGFSSGVRRAIRKAQQGQLEVETSTRFDALESFYALHCRTRKKHGLPPQPFTFFRNLHRFILASGLGFVTVVKEKGRAIAAAVFFRFGAQAIYKFGASDERRQELRGNNLVFWEAIRHCQRLGIKHLSFGRTSLANENLRRFKAGWGAAERICQYYRYDLRSDCFVTAKDDAAGWHNLVFRKMPVPVLRAAGSLLYRHIA
jgi:CelD/BcsL family acetyltransferase involved in cellulose biosynthesis